MTSCSWCKRNYSRPTASLKATGMCSACTRMFQKPSTLDTLHALPFETIAAIHSLFEKANTPRASNPWSYKPVKEPQGVVTQVLTKVRKAKFEALREWDLVLVVLADELYLRLRARWNEDFR